MVTAAVRGAFGFLTRVPVGRDQVAWDAFCRTPAVFPVVGYVIGGLLLIPFVIGIPAATAAVLFVAWVYVVTGITHLDGVADLGDAAVVHGGSDRRRAAMKDTQVGVGAVLAVGIVVLSLAGAGFMLAAMSVIALGIVIAAEVGAKLGIVIIACLGRSTHDGLGKRIIEPADRRDLVTASLVALPAVALTGLHPAAGVTVLGGLLTALAVLFWANRRLDGVSGDVLGATNELCRLVGLHLGVIAWTLW